MSQATNTQRPRAVREWLLVGASVSVSVLIALALLRWLAPQLLGIPVDLQMLQVNREVPPFFEGAFRREDIQSGEFLLQDPITNVRGRPFLVSVPGSGPHDLLGFRNRAIPTIADVVTIGDSQTYGNNAVLEQNWPSQLSARLPHGSATVYSMAIGGWSALQYLKMAEYATALRPRVIVVAFYSGNDPSEAVTLAYGADRWKWIRPEPSLDLKDRPPFPGFPPPASEQWQVAFEDDAATIFTPSLRLISNDTSYATVRAGYEILARAAEHVSRVAMEANSDLILTVIPTKELVYADRIRQERVTAREDYLKLVEHEARNIEFLSRRLQSLPQAHYVDVVAPLQRAAAANARLYPANADGHPLPEGYRVIADALAAAIIPRLDAPITGLVGIRVGDESAFALLVTAEGYWDFRSPDVLRANGWELDDMTMVDARVIMPLPFLGTIDAVDRAKYGPEPARRRQ